MKGTELRDVFGQAVKVGDWVTYPQRQGSSLWMEEARITRVYIRPVGVDSYLVAAAVKADGKQVTLTKALTRMVKAPDGWQPDAFS